MFIILIELLLSKILSMKEALLISVAEQFQIFMEVWFISDLQNRDSVIFFEI